MLEEEQKPEKKKRRKIGTVQNLKTAVTARLHSKPRTEGHEFLEMWSLKRDRARWNDAKEQATEKLKGIEDAIAKVKLPEGEHVSRDGPAEGARVSKTIDFRSCAVREPRT